MAAGVSFRDRIIGFERVKASQLIPNAKNWRTHPKAQKAALEGILKEVGYVDALLARRLNDGTLQLIDGHLRAETTPDAEVPVLIVDLDDAEAAKVLATFDPLGQMAGADASLLESLLDDFSVDDAALEKLLKDTAKDAGIKPETPEIVEDEIPEPPKEPLTKPGDLWLLGVYWECDTCGKRYEYDAGVKMQEVCPCNG